MIGLLSLKNIVVAQQAITNQNIFDTIPFIPEHGAERLARFAKEPVVTGKIMFLGNSITEGGNWKELFNDSGIINRGIGGDITYGLLKRVDDVVIRKPSRLFILIGINDIGKDIPEEIIVDNYQKLVGIILKKSPDTKIFIQSILPLNNTVKGFPQHYNKAAHVVRANKLIRQMCVDMKLDFINLYPLFLDKQQKLNVAYTNDGLHLNADGYKLWAAYFKKKGYLK
jgi:lysophospholipase L1-like esterase